MKRTLYVVEVPGLGFALNGWQGKTAVTSLEYAQIYMHKGRAEARAKRMRKREPWAEARVRALFAEMEPING